MKKILFFALALFSTVVCATGMMASNENPNYVPFARFNNDTLAYVKANFENNKDFYIGKPVSVLLNDFEIPVLSGNSSPSFRVYFNDVRLFFVGYEQRRNECASIVCTVSFTQEYPDVELIEQLYESIIPGFSEQPARLLEPGEANIYDWTPKHAAFYGSRIIKDIEITNYKAHWCR